MNTYAPDERTKYEARATTAIHSKPAEVAICMHKFNHIRNALTYVCVHVCMYVYMYVYKFVGSCLATKVFYRQFASYRKGMGHHKDKWRSITNN